MKKAFLLVVILFMSIISTACINNLAVQQLNNKAKSYLDKGDYANAINRLKSSIDLDSSIFETHYNLGIAYTQAEDYPNAIETFQTAIKIKPNFADTYYSIAVAQENYANAIIGGTLKNKDNQNASENTQPQPQDSEVAPTNKKLTKEETAQVVQLLNDAITSYSTYLDKGAKEEDKQDVQQKIEYLKNSVKKYSNSSN